MTTHGADVPAFLDSNIVLYALGDDDEKCRVATALQTGSAILYTEDLQHGQVIDSRLTLTNPFM